MRHPILPRPSFLRRLLPVAAFAFIGAFVLVASAQPTPPPVPSYGTDDLFHALAGHQWPVAAGVGVFLVVGLFKQGWLSTWLGSKVPAQAQPFVALALSLLSVTSASIAGGTVWYTAILQGIETAAMAVFTHQTVIEGFRGGREIIKQKPPAVAPAS